MPRSRPLYPTTHHEFEQAAAGPSRVSRHSSHPISFISPFVKWLMFAFNFFFWLVACLLIALGVWAYTARESGPGSVRLTSLFDVLLTPSVLVMALGCLVFLLATCGCLGALRENTLLLAIFSWSLLLIFLLECVLGVLAFSLAPQIKSHLQPVISQELIQRYREDRDLQNFVDYVQEEFECCGVSEQGFRDWHHNRYFNCSEGNPSVERCGVPFSCCKEPRDVDGGLVNVECGLEAQDEPYPSDRIYVAGCVDAVFRALRANVHIVAGVLLGTAIPQLIGIYLAKTLSQQIKDQRALWQQ